MIDAAAKSKRGAWPPRAKWILGIAAFAAISWILLAAYRSSLARFAALSLGLSLDLGYTVHYVVPDGYRGIFTVRENPTQGTPPEIREHGEFVYRIPAVGHLETSDITPMLTTHKRKASYQSGRAIGYEGNPEEISLRGVSSMGADRKMRDLIGTEEELNRWWSDHVDWFRIEPAANGKRKSQ